MTAMRWSKIIIQGPSPTLRRIARTHRVNLDRLFDRITVDPGIQIKNVNTSKQSEDILTESSFSREWLAPLTHWFNLMTPHVHINSHFSAVCSSVQKDDKMSKCQADPTVESATAKQRPVRNLCAYVPHPASSSSSSNMNSRWNQTRRDFEQETNGLDSNMQKRSPRKSAILLCWALTSHTDPQAIWRSQWGTEIKNPCQPCALGDLHEFVHVGKCAPQPRGIRCQTHYSNSGRAKNPKHFRKSASADQQSKTPWSGWNWTDAFWRRCSLLDKRISDQLKLKVHVFSGSVLCLGGKCRSSWSGKSLETDRIPSFTKWLQLQPFLFWN